MTIPSERRHAVAWAEAFLERLTDFRRSRRIPREVRLEAGAILRHYPSRVVLSGWDGSPIWGTDTAGAARDDSHPTLTEEPSTDGEDKA